VSHAQRIHCIYLNKVHGDIPAVIAKEEDLPSNSVRNFIKAYDLYGRTNRKLKSETSTPEKRVLCLAYKDSEQDYTPAE